MTPPEWAALLATKRSSMTIGQQAAETLLELFAIPEVGEAVLRTGDSEARAAYAAFLVSLMRARDGQG